MAPPRDAPDFSPSMSWFACAILRLPEPSRRRGHPPSMVRLTLTLAFALACTTAAPSPRTVGTTMATTPDTPAASTRSTPPRGAWDGEEAHARRDRRPTRGAGGRAIRGSLTVGEAPDPRAPRARLTREIVAHRHAIQRCYEDSLGRRAAPRGRIDLALEIDAEGRIMRVRAVASDASLGDAARCLARTLEGWVVPGITAPTELALPFVFAPR